MQQRLLWVVCQTAGAHLRHQCLGRHQQQGVLVCSGAWMISWGPVHQQQQQRRRLIYSACLGTASQQWQHQQQQER